MRDQPKQGKQGRYGRRRVLGMMGAAAAAPLAGTSRGQPGRSTVETTERRDLGNGAFAEEFVTRMAVPPRPPACIVRPSQTEGPYFLEDALQRSDIRADPADGDLRPGLPLILAFRVSLLDGRQCAPLEGAAVDLWQCDALGVYSGVRDRIGGLYDARGSAFLRGWQLTDADGAVRFHTLYPGWYPGRAVHVHFKIRTWPQARRGHEFTSQLYFDDEVSDRVFAAVPYSRNTGRRIRNEQDRIFRRDGGEELLLDLQRAGEGYAAIFDIGLEV